MKGILFLALILATPVLAAETGYRIVQPDGTVEFSDQPAQGAKEIQIQDLPTYPGQTPLSSSPSATQSGGSLPKEPRSSGEKSFAILSPQQQETIWFNENGMTISLDIEPPLSDSDTVVISLDSEVVARGKSNTFTLKNVYRGQHTLSAAITDGQGNMLREASPVSFFMRQHSILNPKPPLSAPSTSTP